MKSMTHIITICILFCCIIILYLNCRKVNGKLSQIEMQQKLSIVMSDNILYESLDDSIVNKAILGNSDEYYDFENKPYYLIFRYNQNMCAPCIRNTLSAIKKVFPDYEENESILFSCSGLDEWMKASLYGKRNLSFIPDSLTLSLEQYQFPYFFIYDQNRIAKCLYVIYSKDDIGRIERYLQMMKKRFLLN